MKVSLPVFNFSVHNKAADESMDVYIDGAIVDPETEHFLKDFFGDDTSISYKTFRNQIEEAKPKLLNLYVNSPGGHVGDALAMHDYLKDLQNKGTTVKVYNRGMVGSAATYFQLAVPVKNREASSNSFGIIHNVQGGVAGDLRDMQNYVSNAEKLNKSIVNMYANSTKLSWQKATDMMDAETLLNASEMLDLGFVGSITGSEPLTNKIDISKIPFKNKAILNAYNSFTQPQNNSMENKILDAITNGFNNLFEKLGITNKKDEQPVQDAMKEFSESIVNAIKENVQTTESIQTIVTDSVTAAMQNAITIDVVKNEIKEATKDNLTSEKLKNELSTFKTGLIKELGNKIINKTDGEEKPKKHIVKAVQNKYSASYEDFEG